MTLTLVRELGPVVTALLFAGRAGTSLTAEIGLMKAGEQISVMEMMAVDPVQRILAPRFWAGVITMPLLAAVFSAMGIIGGWVVGVLMIGVDGGSFWSQIQERRRCLARPGQRHHQEHRVWFYRDFYRAAAGF